MKCPVCKNSEQLEIDLHAEGFYEDLFECCHCGTAWSVNHGVLEVIKDSQDNSFLQARSESVEGDDYNLAV